MPLEAGSSKNVIEHNIKKLIGEKYKPSQAAAIAYHNAQKHKRDSMFNTFNSPEFNTSDLYSENETKKEKAKDPEISRVQGAQGAY